MTSRPKAAPARNFVGFPAEGLRFLRELADNNDPVWFKPRRDEYETLVRGPMVALVADLLTLAASRKLPLSGDPPKAVFRIHRDVRLAKDRRPYKTHCGASLSRTGERLAPGLLYVHLEPERSFVGVGFWHTEPALLDRLRQRMIAAPGPFLKMARVLDTKGMPIEPDEEAVKRLPRGCEAARDTPVEPFVKHRNLLAQHHLTDKQMQTADLPDLLLERFAAARPLLEFGWAVVDGKAT